MFALDRMLSMETGTEKFQLPEKFNAHDYFAGIYGARVYPDMKPETVILKVSARQAKYFRSLPLHQSQEVVEETPEFSSNISLLPTMTSSRMSCRSGTVSKCLNLRS